ncbi:HipA domain-containing protein [Acinetobacter pullicarnis]|uniref:hypothetical protein n=1 Tax=Acinetobacter pullicarnis TaxID=2576829 RepID=UPI00111EE06B|nr:hypothetical protein [Acinetobacter pullicarnis]
MSKTDEFLITNLTNMLEDHLESLGTKHKFWYISQKKRYLYKSIKVTRNGSDHYRYGEDCSEKIACEIAKILSIPHLHYELAIFNGLRGVMSENFISDDGGESLVLGNSLLESFNSDDSEVQVHQTIDQVYDVLENIICKKPLDFDSLPNIKTASEFFIGYLMLDALISNQDRHNENWGAIQKIDGTFHLALTFDHGASLGKNITDKEKEERLNTHDHQYSVKAYSAKARSWFFLNTQKKSRLKVMQALSEMGRYHPLAYREWVKRLELVDDILFLGVIERIPASLMSQISKKFAFEMIKSNKRTIIENFYQNH